VDDAHLAPVGEEGLDALCRHGGDRATAFQDNEAHDVYSALIRT
jgi:hypothetical protein